MNAQFLRRKQFKPVGYRYLTAGEKVRSGDQWRSDFPDLHGEVWRPAYGIGSKVKKGGLRYIRIKPTKNQ